MTPARDTHELRLDQWPRLSTFPTTNAVIAGAILLDFVTAAAWIFGRMPPEGWLLFLAGLHGIATSHFGIKRRTDFRNGNGNGKTDAGPTP
jgi:hypothetical protein